MARSNRSDKLQREVEEYKRKHGIKKREEEAVEENEEEVIETEKEPTFWQQMIPFFLIISALLIVVCFLFTKQTGWFGAAISGLFYGMFSFVSWVIPMLLVFLAIFWRKDSFKSTMKSKFIVMGLIAVILSCGAFYMSVMAGGGETPSMTPANIWKMAQKENGFKYGGIIGSYLGWVVFKVFSKVGTPIVLGAALIVMCIFLFDIKPDTAWRFVKKVSKFVWKGICKGVKKIYYKITKKATADKKIYINKPGSTAAEEGETANNESCENESGENGGTSTEKSKTEVIKSEKKTKKNPQEYLNEIFSENGEEQTENKNAEASEEVQVNITTYNKKNDNNGKIFGAEAEEQGELNLERVPLMTTVEAGDAIPENGFEYVFPPIDFLKKNEVEDLTDEYEEECRATGKKLVEVLKSFKVDTRLVNISRGPTITRYELAPEEGVKVKQISALADDIALNLAANGAVRIEAPIVGKAAVGVEVVNAKRETVYLRSLLENPIFKNSKSKLIAALGLDVAGDPVYMDIVKMPHILIAGTTGAGKSVCINSIVLSLLYNASPDEVKLIMIDPKKVEFGIYKDLPHLRLPVTSDPKEAAGTLMWAVEEMERRYDIIEKAGVRDISGYNEITKDDPEQEYLPKIVIIIDELADLMMTASDTVETSICRIAQKGRACGMHLIIGTQRPSVDVITGLIKANIPSRIAFTVSQQVDSRTIIDVGGAEKLTGKGDMLYAPTGVIKPIRLQGAFVSDKEVDEITEFIRSQNRIAEFKDEEIDKIKRNAEKCNAKGSKKSSGSGDEEFEENSAEEVANTDEKFRDAVEVALQEGKISTSLLQRKIKLGYGRAAKIIDAMEALGIAGPSDGQKPRDVRITREEWEEMSAVWYGNEE